MKLPSLKSITQSSTQRRQLQYRRLLQEEARIGGELFGPISSNARREFFCLNESTWMWHEEWTDEVGQPHAVTTRYDVRPNGIMKIQDGQPHRSLSSDEAKNFGEAVKIYAKRVLGEVYSYPA